MNSFANANRHADGHSFVSPCKRASEPDMVIANTTSTSSTSTSTNAPVPQLQEQSAEGVDQALEKIVDTIPDIRVGANENDQQLAEQTKPLLDQAWYCGDAQPQDKAHRIYDAIKSALSSLMQFQQAQSGTASPTAKKAKKGSHKK